MSRIRLGKPDVRIDYAAHVPGVRQGNHEGGRKRTPGHLANGHSTARRSTGVNAKRHEPLLPDMPNLSPA